VACTNASFGGDPVPYVSKHCDADYSQASNLPVASWTKCADQYGTCSFSGTRLVRYGAGVNYLWRYATQSTPCDDRYGDPLPGHAKQCEIQP